MSIAIQLKRGSRASLDMQAQRGNLAPGEPLLIQDEERLAVALSPTSYVSFAKSQEISAIASDDVLYTSEKPAVVQEYDVLQAEKSALEASAVTHGIVTEKVTYSTAMDNLAAYLGALTGWNVVPGVDVVIVGDTFRTKFHDVYAAREALRLRITEATAVALAAAEIPETLSELNLVEGTKLGTIESGATRNIGRGEWQEATEYAVGDNVTFFGSSWTAKTLHTSSLATRPPADPATLALEWHLTASTGVNYEVEIQSTNGTTFRVGQGRTTVLKALVFKNGMDVTSTIPFGWFRWTRVSTIAQESPNDDATWNTLYQSGYSQISLNVDDVYAKATFFCDILTP